MKHPYLFLAFLSLSLYGTAQQQKIEAKEILIKMINQINHTKSLSYKFKKYERMQDGFSSAEQDVKLLTEPMKAHIYVHKPHKGTVATWSANENNGDLQVTPGWMPFVKLNLSPQSDEVRKNNHQSIHKLGFDFVATIISNSLQKHASSLSEVLQYAGVVNINKRDCHKIIIEFRDYKYYSYTLKANETLLTIADRFRVNEYMLLLNNPHIKSISEVKPGIKINIPNEYAKRTELYIDKENMMPIVQRMYDEKGLFEQYEFLNLTFNPALKEDIFVATSGAF